MDIKYLEYVLETANQKNITRAADTLFVSQSAISQYLMRLEEEIGTPLFERTKNELVLTAAGELYVEAAKSVVDIRHQLYKKIAALDNSGRIRLGLSSKWGIDMLTRLLPLFRKEFPKVTVEVYHNKYRRLDRMLAEGKLDIVVTATSDPIICSGDYTMLRREEIYLAVPADHHFCLSHEGGEKKLSHNKFAEVFANENFICSDNGSTLQLIEQKLFQQLSIKPRIMCEVNDNMAALSMVENGMGMAFIPVDYLRSGCGALYWELDPGLFRNNILVIRKQLQKGEAEKYLIRLILSDPLFK